MRRRSFIALLLSLVTIAACESQTYYKPGLLIRGSSSGVFGFVGDSNMDGRSTAGLPTIPSGRLKFWNSGTSVYDDITNQSVSNGGAFGSMAYNFAVEHFNSTGQPVYLVNGASGGSNFYPDGDTNCWYSSGCTLYGAFTTKMTNALLARGALKPDGIFVNLGINDFRSIEGAAETYANYQLGVTSLFNRLTTDYPGVPIYVIIPGRAETPTYSYNNATGYAVRQYQRNAAVTYPDVHIIANALTWVDDTTVGAGNGYMADGLHYTQPMLDQLGTIANRYIQSTISNKWARAVVCSRFSDYSGAFATALATAITNLVTSGDYFKLEPTTLTVSPSQDERDCLLDITFLSNTVLFNGPTVNSDHCLEFNGSSQYMSTIYIPQWFNQSGAGQDNYIIGARLMSRTTASGVSANLIGKTVGTVQVRVTQTIVPSLIWYPSRNASETWSGGDTSLQNAFYAVARDGGTGYLYKGTTQVDNAVSASAGVLGETIVTMALYNGSPSQYLGGSISYHTNMAFTGVNLSTVLTNFDNVVSAR